MLISFAVTAATLAVCLLALLALGLAERIARDRAWRQVPIRVHVNGSRGKSTVTRLVWSALRAAGIPALGKTTGTQPRLLLPDGSEQPLTRRAPASIREQLALLRRARRLGVEALVVECMALDPELQWISEQHMVRASVGVITNVRRDHQEVMGADLETIASTLANTIPRDGVLVTGEERHAALFSARAAELRTRVVSAERVAREHGEPSDWLAEDTAIAIAVTRQLGIDDETARRGFATAPADPGAVSTGALRCRGRRLRWLDATAANDPDSLGMLAGAFPYRVVIYNHRSDRAPRLVAFTRHAAAMTAAGIMIVTGDRPPWTVWRTLRRARPRGETAFVAARRLAARLRVLPDDSGVLFCGNTRGFDLAALLREVSSDG